MAFSLSTPFSTHTAPLGPLLHRRLLPTPTPESPRPPSGHGLPPASTSRPETLLNPRRGSLPNPVDPTPPCLPPTVRHDTCRSPPILHTSHRRRADPIHARSGHDRGFGLPPIGAAMDQSRWTMESYSSSRMVDGVTANYNKVLWFFRSALLHLHTISL